MQMRITLVPVRGDMPLVAERQGGVLVLNGAAVDLASGEASPWIVSAMRAGGAWEVTLLLPHGADAPEATRFPAPVVLDGDGPVALPPFQDEAAEV